MKTDSSSMIRLSEMLPRLTYALPVFLTVEVVATASPTPTPEPAPTATVAPEEEEEPLEVPDRGYNSVGSPDAPVTLFDFSDFT